MNTSRNLISTLVKVLDTLVSSSPTLISGQGLSLCYEIMLSCYSHDGPQFRTKDSNPAITTFHSFIYVKTWIFRLDSASYGNIYILMVWCCIAESKHL